MNLNDNSFLSYISEPTGSKDYQKDFQWISARKGKEKFYPPGHFKAYFPHLFSLFCVVKSRVQKNHFVTKTIFSVTK